MLVRVQSRAPNRSSRTAGSVRSWPFSTLVRPAPRSNERIRRKVRNIRADSLVGSGDRREGGLCAYVADAFFYSAADHRLDAVHRARGVRRPVVHEIGPQREPERHLPGGRDQRGLSRRVASGDGTARHQADRRPARRHPEPRPHVRGRAGRPRRGGRAVPARHEPRLRRDRRPAPRRHRAHLHADRSRSAVRGQERGRPAVADPRARAGVEEPFRNGALGSRRPAHPARAQAHPRRAERRLARPGEARVPRLSRSAADDGDVRDAARTSSTRSRSTTRICPAGASTRPTVETDVSVRSDIVRAEDMLGIPLAVPGGAQKDAVDRPHRVGRGRPRRSARRLEVQRPANGHPRPQPRHHRGRDPLDRGRARGSQARSPRATRR